MESNIFFWIDQPCKQQINVFISSSFCPLHLSESPYLYWSPPFFAHGINYLTASLNMYYENITLKNIHHAWGHGINLAGLYFPCFTFKITFYLIFSFCLFSLPLPSKFLPSLIALSFKYYVFDYIFYL